MRQRMTLVLIALLVLVSSSLYSCDRQSLSEKDVLEIVYNYCSSRCEQLQGLDAEVEAIDFDWQFTGYLFKINQGALENGNSGKSVTLEIDSPNDDDIYSPTIYEEALKQIVKYQGNGLWSVSLFVNDTAIWEVNDLSREVKPMNEGARSFIESTTLKTYHNNKAFYSIDYNPSWVVDDTDKGWVTISPPDRDTECIIISARIQTVYQQLSSYIQDVLNYFRENYDDFHLIERTDTTIEFTHSQGKWIAKHHFLQQGSVVYEIMCWAVHIPGLETDSMLNDPYESFRLNLEDIISSTPVPVPTASPIPTPVPTATPTPSPVPTTVPLPTPTIAPTPLGTMFTFSGHGESLSKPFFVPNQGIVTVVTKAPYRMTISIDLRPMIDGTISMYQGDIVRIYSSTVATETVSSYFYIKAGTYAMRVDALNIMEWTVYISEAL